MDRPKTAKSLLLAYNFREIDFPKLLSEFEALPMAAPYSLRPNRTWGDVYREAEEGDDTDVPEAILSATYSGVITEAERARLLKIYTRKVPN